MTSKMESGILNIEEIVMGQELPDPPAADAPQKPSQTYKPINLNGPTPSIQPYQHDNLQCFQCFITFCSAKAKERHMKKSHREEYKQQLQQGNTLFTCYVCDRAFLSSEELTQHQPTHSKDDKPFKCVHCKESFKTFSELTAHRRQICPERQFVCKDCNEVFRSAGLLRTHRLTQHPRPDSEGPEPPAEPANIKQCKKCSQVFDTEVELTAHQEKYSGDQQCNGSTAVRKRGRPAKVEEPVAADKKGKRKKKDDGDSSEEASESVTEAPEEKEKEKEKVTVVAPKRGRPRKAPVKSDEEDAKSPPEDSEEPAKKPKAEPVASKQIPCTDCDLSFSSLPLLRAHKKEKHSPRKAHPCEECEESFARAEQLDAHMSRNHAVGRLACPTCGKSFGRERTLKAHQKSHAEEKPEEPASKR